MLWSSFHGYRPFCTANVYHAVVMGFVLSCGCLPLTVCRGCPCCASTQHSGALCPLVAVLLYCRRSHALWVRLDCVQGLSIACATTPVFVVSGSVCRVLTFVLPAFPYLVGSSFCLRHLPWRVRGLSVLCANFSHQYLCFVIHSIFVLGSSVLIVAVIVRLRRFPCQLHGFRLVSVAVLPGQCAWVVHAVPNFVSPYLRLEFIRCGSYISVRPHVSCCGNDCAYLPIL